MFLKTILLLIILPTGFLFAGDKGLSPKLYQQALEIHQKILTLDSHTDTPLMFGRKGFDISQRNNPREGGGQLDFPRMEEGGLDAVFFAVFLSQGQSSDSAFDIATGRAIRSFGQIHEILEQNKDKAALALTPEDAYRLKKEGKRAVYIGLENAYPIGNDLSLTQKFFDLGARYITLSHTRNNHFSDSSNDPEGPIHGGLSDQGRELIKLMNRMGMMIDVSHISDAAFYDVLEISELPVVASHSNTRAINDDPRNIDDDMLRALAKNGGVLQLCFLYVKEMPANPERDEARAILRAKYNNFQNLSDQEMDKAREEWFDIDFRFPSELPTVSDLIDHMDYVVKIVGIDHVGIGSDFDGGGQLKDCFDVSEMHHITAEMLHRGYSIEDIEKVWSGNFMRVFKANQMAASK